MCDELRTNQHGYFECRHQALAANVPLSFPDPAVIRLYTHAVTSSLLGRPLPACAEWRPKLPDITALAVLCEKLFSWATDLKLVQKFRAAVWEGYGLRYMLQLANDSTANNTMQIPMRPFQTIQNNFTVKSILSIQRLRLRSTITAPYHAYSIEVLTSPFIYRTLHGLDLNGLRPQEGVGVATMQIWIPVVILERALPAVVSAFKAAKKRPTLTEDNNLAYIPVRPRHWPLRYSI